MSLSNRGMLFSFSFFWREIWCPEVMVLEANGMPWLGPASVIAQNSGNRDVLLGCSTPAFLSVQLSAGGSSHKENSYLPSSHFILSLLRSCIEKKQKFFQSAVWIIGFAEWILVPKALGKYPLPPAHWLCWMENTLCQQKKGKLCQGVVAG